MGRIDETAQVVKEYGEERLRYFYQENQERSSARNRGITNSKGAFLCFLDSDDYFLPHHLEMLALEIQKHDKAESTIFRTASFAKAKGKLVLEKYPVNVDPVSFFWDQGMALLPFAFPRKIFQQFTFPLSFRNAEDFHFTIRSLLQFGFKQIPEVSTVFVVHKDQTSWKRMSLDIVDECQNHVEALRNLVSIAPQLFQHVSRKRIERKIGLTYGMYATGAFKSGQKETGILLRKETTKYLPDPAVAVVYIKLLIRQSLFGLLK